MPTNKCKSKLKKANVYSSIAEQVKTFTFPHLLNKVDGNGSESFLLLSPSQQDVASRVK